MKLSNLQKLMNALPPDVDLQDPEQRNEYLRRMGLDPGSIYQELEMESPLVDSHQDISYSNTQVNLHSHAFYELLYCCNSCGAEYLVGAERYRLQKGDVILVPPGLSHRPLLPERLPEPYRRIVLWISPEFMAGLLHAFPELLNPMQVCSVLLRTADTRWEFLGDLFQSGLQMAQAGGPEWQMLLTGNTVTLLAHIRRAFLDRSASAMRAEHPELLDRVIGYIEENLSQRITLTEAARHFYVSESTISQTFRKKMGVSFYHCVIQRRLIAAKQAILEGHSLERVAELTGFTDYSAFYRAFKQEYGISPRQFRKTSVQNAAERSQRLPLNLNEQQIT